jgi:hypothetical protein
MRHHAGARRSGAARFATTLVLLVSNACAPDEASVVVVVGGAEGRAVIASPIDPRTLRTATTRELASGPVVTSMARYYAALDSADSLDAVFQRTRDELTPDARRLAQGDRRTPEYAREYDAYMSRVAIATRTREARDRLRRRAIALRAQLERRGAGQLHGDSQVFARLRSLLDSAARSKGRSLVRAEIRDRRATLDLEPGVWWLVVEHDSGLLGPIRRHQARDGARDTVRIGA